MQQNDCSVHPRLGIHDQCRFVAPDVGFEQINGAGSERDLDGRVRALSADQCEASQYWALVSAVCKNNGHLES